MENNFTFVEVKNDYWVPETAGEQLIGVVVNFETIDTVHGQADVAVISDFEGVTEKRVVIGGGLNTIKDKIHQYVRITYEGEKENPNPKRGRSKTFKAYKLEVAQGFDYASWSK